MRSIISYGISAFMLLQITAVVNGQPLAGTDGLGRTLPQNKQVGDPKANRQVGLFYFTWHGDGTAEDYWDLSEIISNHPEVLNDYDSEFWGKPVYYPPNGEFVSYYWGKPVYGYYRGDDYWVVLRSMQLLTDAGVDFVVIDATNLAIYPKNADILMSAMDAVRTQGKIPPGIVFYTNTDSGERIQELYDTFYKPGAPYRHPDAWYRLEGKPLVLGVREETKGREYEDFFTYRESQWPYDPPKPNGWPWLSFTRPQVPHYNIRGEKEIINVSVSQHPNPKAGFGGSAFYGNRDNWGRSYRNGSHGKPETDMPYGYNIQEQWDYALTQNTPFVFVTGWNEWIAGRWDSKDDNPEHSWFCDMATPEYSRDIEPASDPRIKDHYYMQLAANIRRYKGVEKNPAAGPAKTIKKMSDWTSVSPTYTDYTGETKSRNHPGAQSKPAYVYTNTTGRNDFRTMKVSRDNDNLYFYAETVNDITPESGDNWMRLYVDSDRNPKTGWNGYDYRIIEGKILQRYVGGNSWKSVQAVKSVTEKNKMTITVPKASLENLSTPINIEFKWTDNMQADDPMDWYINGDVAPGGRFNYAYTVE